MSSSHIRVSNINQSSCLIECKNEVPIKILNPRSIGDMCHVVISNYGGGVVGGDQYHIGVSVDAHSQLYLTTQSYTKIFKNISGMETLQSFDFSLQSKSTTVVFSDPIVPQKDSLFEQKLHFDLKSDANLIYIDWVYPGRMFLEEIFEYQKYTSGIKINVDDIMVFKDSFKMEPLKYDPKSPMYFGCYRIMMNIILMGSGSVFELSNVLERHLDQTDPHQIIGSATPIQNKGVLFKILGTSTDQFLPVIYLIFEQLKNLGIMSASPLDRKF